MPCPVSSVLATGMGEQSGTAAAGAAGSSANSVVRAIPPIRRRVTATTLHGTMRRVTRTVPQLFDDAVANAPDRTWLLHEDEAYTYAQARARIGAAAAALAERRVGKGDRVLFPASTSADHLLLWLAIAYAGAI